MTDHEKPLLARVRRPKEPLDLIRQTAEAEAVILPPLSPDEALEARGQEVTKAVTAAYMTAGEVYHQIHTEKLWERRGYADPAPYFEERIGVAYRTFMQALAVWSAHLALPEDVRPAARQALEAIGVSKAAVIAPAIKEHPEQWAEWTAAAKELNREALQEKVSRSRGLPPTNSKKAGDRLYGTFVSLLSAEERVEFEEYIRAGFAVAETKDFLHVIKCALIEAAPSWLAQAERIAKGHGNA
jgi:hypothetical protein